MVLVTNLQYYMDKALKAKIDLMIDRCTRPNPKRDAVLLIEGGEGEGKTNMAFQIAYLVSYETGRPFSNDNVFFRAEDVLKFAQNTEKQIIVYDEPALDMMSSEWWKKEQINLVKLLMTARKKRHFIIFNITKFYKFNEYIVVDRALGMVHVYSRNEIEPGRFVYIKKKNIEHLFLKYKSSKKRLYKKFYSLHGTFPDFVDGILDLEKYEKDKDAAIMSIGVESKVHPDKQALWALKKKIGLIRDWPVTSKADLARRIGLRGETLIGWSKLKVEESPDGGGPSLVTRWRKYFI